MSVSSLHRVAALKIGATLIGQIVDQEVTDEIQEFLARDSASIYNRAAAVDLETVRFSVTTEAVKTALGAVPLSGVDLSASAAEIYFAQYDPGGGLKANSCVKFTLSKGIAVWRSLSARDGLANVVIEVAGVSSDGSSSPVAIATGVSIPTIATKEMYVAGGSAGVQGFDVETGVELTLQRGDGDVYHTLAAIDLIQPRITWSQTDMAGQLGPVTDINTMTLRDCVQGGGRGTSPITLTISQSMAHPRRIGGTPTMTEYELLGTWDGANAPITLAGL